MTTKYTDAVANAFSEAKAWRTTSLALMLLCGVLAFSLIYQSRTTPYILVPSDFATAQGNVKITPNQPYGTTSPDYLSQIALGDLALALNWTPNNVEVQTKRFFNRMTVDLYTEQNVAMMQQALSYKSSGMSQSFYPSTTKVKPNSNEVTVDGYLVRWTGEKESLRANVTYTITYVNYKGYAHVASLQIQNK